MPLTAHSNLAQFLILLRLEHTYIRKDYRLVPLQAYAALLPSCSCMRWDSAANDALHRTVEKVICSVRCWHLECLPDEEAARVCNAAVTGVADI